MPEPDKRRRVASFVILLMVFVDILGFGIILPLLPLYARDFGATDLQIGMLMASASAMVFIFSPVWGRVSDRVGRKPVVVLTLVGSTLSYGMFGFAPTLAWLFAARIVVGITGATINVAQAYMADLTPPEKRAHGMGLIGTAFGIGFACGPALGGLLSPLGRGVPGYVASLIALTGLILATVYLPESRTGHTQSPSEPAPWDVLRNRGLLPLMAFYLLLSFGQSNVFAMYALWMHDRLGFGTLETGLVFTGFGGLLGLTQGLAVKRVVARLGERRALLVAVAALLAGYTSLVFVKSAWPLAILVVVQAFGAGLSNPSLLALVSRAAPPGRQGWVLGLNQSGGGLARVAGPLWGGYVFHLLGPSGPFLTASVICAALLVAGISLSRAPRATIADGASR